MTMKVQFYRELRKENMKKQLIINMFNTWDEDIGKIGFGISFTKELYEGNKKYYICLEILIWKLVVGISFSDKLL
jgi:hypothetical protein